MNSHSIAADAAAGDALRIGARIDIDVVLGIDVHAHGFAHGLAGHQELKHFFLVFQFGRLGVDRVGVRPAAALVEIWACAPVNALRRPASNTASVCKRFMKTP